MPKIGEVDWQANSCNKLSAYPDEVGPIYLQQLQNEIEKKNHIVYLSGWKKLISYKKILIIWS